MSSGVMRGCALAVLLGATVAQAAEAIQAVRADGPLHVDGRLDEPAWAKAPVFDAFVERFPVSGRTPSERTEVRVLYDAETLYVGIVAHDSQPALIDRRMGRRDDFPYSDAVRLIIDPMNDRRTGYGFAVNAGGIQEDGLYYDDRNYTTDWGGVWDAAVGNVEDGWVAEYAIPLSLLRFPEAPVQSWGFSVRRDIARKNEELESVENPREAAANVSRLGRLTGLVDLQPRGRWELVPYVAARGVMRPQFSDAAQPTPRMMSPVLDVGLDVRGALSSGLMLNATFNPDFGELEADQLLLNLSTFESYYSERRPFFTQGMELFQPVGWEGGRSPLTMFYSRRVGLETPILGAAKLTGTVGPGVQVGVLDALVAGPWQAQDEANPDRRLRVHPSRPLHLGPDAELPGAPLATTNFLAAAARAPVGTASRVGVSFASALPMAGLCREEDAALDDARQPAECRTRGGNVLGMDFDLRSANREWAVYGQLNASQVVRGLPERTLHDGTVLRRGDMGVGGYLRAGRFSGNGFRADVGVDFASPTLSLVATGFQRAQNEQTPRFTLRYERQDGLGPLKLFRAIVTGGAKWTADSRATFRGAFMDLNLIAILPTFDLIELDVGTDVGGYDVRALDSTGVPLEREGSHYVNFYVESNAKRAMSIGGNASMALHRAGGPTPARVGWGGDVFVSVRPHPSLETRVEVGNDRTPYVARFVENLGNSHFILGDLKSNYLSLTLRQQWILTPHLTLQGYAQLFTDYGVYGRYFSASSNEAKAPIRLADLTPVDRADADSFYDTALNVNVVLRWEYRLGSTLFLVYSRAQQGLPAAEGDRPAASLLPKRLLAGPANDAVLLKWSYYWGA
ncbi:carbohydrate binding family 9 domain-containing protein [Corallococcus sp. M34]|nr:carbohydrate binding family 9 domain-containing protein [Citreicoccus inhibens]